MAALIKEEYPVQGAIKTAARGQVFKGTRLNLWLTRVALALIEEYDLLQVMTFRLAAARTFYVCGQAQIIC
jgi:hypothetical protein